MRFEGIYGLAWTSRHSNGTAWKIAKDEWGNALSGIDPAIIRLALTELRDSGEQFPPTLPKFLNICRDRSGIPDQETTYQLAIRKEFNHPIIRLCFNKIGSWELSRGLDKDLRKIFPKVYKEAVNEFFSQESVKKLDHQ